MSLDGYGAGPDQSLEHPMGQGGRDLHGWFYPTKTFRSMLGKDDGIDDRFARATAEGIDLPGLGYKVTEVVPTELATHIVLTR